MRTLELGDYGVMDLDDSVSENTNGGWLTAAIIVAFAISAINNFGDIREGVSDAWNGKPPRY